MWVVVAVQDKINVLRRIQIGLLQLIRLWKKYRICFLRQCRAICSCSGPSLILSQDEGFAASRPESNSGAGIQLAAAFCGADVMLERHVLIDVTDGAPGHPSKPFVCWGLSSENELSQSQLHCMIELKLLL